MKPGRLGRRWKRLVRALHPICAPARRDRKAVCGRTKNGRRGRGPPAGAVRRAAQGRRRTRNSRAMWPIPIRSRRPRCGRRGISHRTGLPGVPTPVRSRRLHRPDSHPPAKAERWAPRESSPGRRRRPS
jgi:hypothetical protein